MADASQAYGSCAHVSAYLIVDGAEPGVETLTRVFNAQELRSACNQQGKVRHRSP